MKRNYSYTMGVVYPFGNGNGHCCRSPPLTLSPSDNLPDLLKGRIIGEILQIWLMIPNAVKSATRRCLKNEESICSYHFACPDTYGV